MGTATAIGATDGVDAMADMPAIIGPTIMEVRASICASVDIGTITAFTATIVIGGSRLQERHR